MTARLLALLVPLLAILPLATPAASAGSVCVAPSVENPLNVVYVGACGGEGRVEVDLFGRPILIIIYCLPTFDPGPLPVPRVLGPCGDLPTLMP